MEKMAAAQLVIAASQDCGPQKLSHAQEGARKVFVMQSAEDRFGTDRIRFSPAMAWIGTWKDEAAGRAGTSSARTGSIRRDTTDPGFRTHYHQSVLPLKSRERSVSAIRVSGSIR